MSDNENPYGGQQGGYSTNMQFGSAAPAPAGDGGDGPLVFDTTTQGFQKEVMEESKKQPVLVDFWAPWCGPCRQLAPALEKVVKNAKGRVKLAKMNIDEHPAIPGQLGIQSIPAVIAFKNGQPVDGFMGAVPETQIQQFIDKLAGGPAPDPMADAMAMAREAEEKGDLQSAMQVYGAILQQDPQNAEALAGAATIMYETGEKERAAELLEQVPADKAGMEAVTALKARMALDKEVEGLGDPMELARRLADNPKDHAARLDLALIENARGEREKAAEHLLAIIKADKGWNDGAARDQLLKFFEAWGMADEATLSARRRLSSLLFS